MNREIARIVTKMMRGQDTRMDFLMLEHATHNDSNDTICKGISIFLIYRIEIVTARIAVTISIVLLLNNRLIREILCRIKISSYAHETS